MPSVGPSAAVLAARQRADAARRMLAEAEKELARLDEAEEAGVPGPPLDRATLERALRMENDIRMGEEGQRRFAEAERREDTDWMTEADLIQREVLRSLGVRPANEARALAQFRAAVAGPDADPELAKIPVYVRFQRARRGTLHPPCSAPDVALYTLEGTATTLLAQQRPGIPLVVLAGRADLLAVYIREAHASDEWPIRSARFARDGKPVEVRAHVSLNDRARAAAGFRDAFGFRVPILLDGMDDAFDAAYAPWPIRFFVLQDGRAEFVSEPVGAEIDVATLGCWLRERLGESGQVA
ncbi:hypothetical protein DFJ74DRAFT_764160 [Hyaloraphidium curvatum]|nr:hypothetical protein DFJ74DRAFT_764160 [Hyaloraphidium curvatum]